MAAHRASLVGWMYAALVGFWIYPRIQPTTDSAFLTTDISLASRRSRSREWLVFGTKEYQFVLDAGRLLDKTRNEAKAACKLKQADLVSIETEEELEFIKDQIRAKIRERGQQLLSYEQWWTNGISYKQSHWIWDTPTLRPVQISALKRRTVPRTGTHYLALSHPGGWRLKIVPGNFRLRYICQRGRRSGGKSPTLAATGDPNYHVMRNLTRHDMKVMASTLRSRLLTGYNSQLPSRLGGTGAMRQDGDVMRMEIDLIQIQDNVSAEEVMVKQHIQTVWLDERLSWTPELYGGLSYLHINMKDVWYPTIKALTSSGTLHEVCENADLDNLVTLRASGSLTLLSSCDVVYNCTLQKPAAFPFDHRRCRLLLFIEQDDDTLVEMVWNKGDTTLDRGFHRAWRASGLEGTQVEWTQSGNPQLMTDNVCIAQLTLYLHRNVLYHILTLLVPCLFLSVVLVIILWLPHGSPVKCITTLVVASAFLLYLVVGGQHTKEKRMSYSDMFMIVMSVIGTIALTAQIYIIRLISRHKKQAPPPSFMERFVSDKSQKEKRDELAKCREMAPLHERERCGRAMEKLSEERELMLEEPTLGLTTLGRDGKRSERRSHRDGQSCDQYVTLPRDRYAASAKEAGAVGQSRTLPANSRPSVAVRFKDVPERYVPNGTAGRGGKDSRTPGPTGVTETSLSLKTHSSPNKIISYAYDDLSLAYRSESRSAPEHVAAKARTMTDSDWKKCITWVDRGISFVISAAVIFTIMIFIILFLAT